MKRAPQHAIAKLVEIRRLAAMDDASFGFVTELVSVTGMGNDPDLKTPIDEFIKGKTRPYRETWLLPVIDELIGWAKGESAK